jgi:hypothetical protein
MMDEMLAEMMLAEMMLEETMLVETMLVETKQAGDMRVQTKLVEQGQQMILSLVVEPQVDCSQSQCHEC